ncbi:hypothetical protein KUM42_08850 [Modestobacter sp. L9-4]|uniref:hypothetical protein n=1 Tax=Modestobacter sp. L9-4 TaxID=2851567 RepID=UPI001C797251|nr:hypothetical protein [Modestobacter sp. L9-4]QXG77585.1 hypothetical protein KUM42_08850 [Modestobacter sp. L9-4]
MRRLLVLLLGGLLVLTGWVLAPAASACSCAPATTAEQLARADVVFTGTLVSRELLRPDPVTSRSDDPVVHVFAVDTVLKGAAGARQTVVSAASSASCGLGLSGDGPFLVLATAPSDDPTGQLTAGLCSGTGPVPPGLAAQVQVLAAGAGTTGGAGTTVGPGTPGGPGVADVPVDPFMGTYVDPPTSTFLLLLGGLLGLTVLVGGLAAWEGRRADRRELRVVVLTRD